MNGQEPAATSSPKYTLKYWFEVKRAKELAAWHDGALNWDYPPDPGPWRQDECDRFNAASQELLSNIRRELGSDFEIIDHQPPLMEDPDLDRHLEDPKNFRR